MPRKLLEKGVGGLGWSLMDVVVNALTAFFLVFMIFLMIPKEDLVNELIRNGQKILKEELKKGIKDSTVYKLEVDGHRQTITLGSNVLFQTCDWEIQYPGNEILTSIANVLTAYQGKIYDPELQAGYFSTISIEGHTDSLAVLRGCGSFIRSNWHLSSMRAISVLQFFEAQGLDAKRMSATGYGSTRPVSTDLSLNRRVEITLVYSPEEIRKVVGEYWAKVNAARSTDSMIR